MFFTVVTLFMRVLAGVQSIGSGISSHEELVKRDIMISKMNTELPTYSSQQMKTLIIWRPHTWGLVGLCVHIV